MCSITTEPVSARTCPKHRPRRTGPSGPKNITTPLHHIGKRGPMCKHLKGRSGLCRRFRLGREKRNRAAGLLNSFNGGSGCTSDCEVNLSREFTLGQQSHTMLAAASQARRLQRDRKGGVEG